MFIVLSFYNTLYLRFSYAPLCQVFANWVTWIFETRIAIVIMTNQHQLHGCEEDIAMFNIIEIIAQLYCLWKLKQNQEIHNVHWCLSSFFLT